WLRYLLVQDYDLDDDGRPETLRLRFAAPRPWLEDGKESGSSALLPHSAIYRAMSDPNSSETELWVKSGCRCWPQRRSFCGCGCRQAGSLFPLRSTNRWSNRWTDKRSICQARPAC